MRLAYFVWEYPPRFIGGLGTYAAEMTAQLAAMGHEVTVFTMNEGANLPTFEEIGERIDVHRPIVADATAVLPVFVDEELRRWGEGLRFFGDVLTYNFLSANLFVNKIAKRENYDLVVCHDWLSAIAGVIAQKNTGKPMVFHVHSTEHGRSGGRGSSTIRNLEYTTAQHADMIITVSYAMREELHVLNFPGARIRVMWNGVDEKKYNIANFPPEERAACRQRLGFAEDDKVILFTGRLTFVKGVDSLVRAMPLVLARVPKARLVILGRGEMADEIRSLIVRHGLKDKVVLIDKWVEERERLLLYACCDVVCAPSRYEPFGIVSLEGMAMSKPVVVGLGGLRESVLDGKNGFWCEPDKPESIAAALTRVLEDEGAAKAMGEAGRRRVEKLFTWEKIAHETIELYESLL
ncbi:MAG: glycosyltransferase family 4 protein [Candidatus Micrarchaeia archaeon]